MMVRTFRTAIWALVLAATAVGASTAAWACILDAQGGQACGGCFDTITGACTGDPCSKEQPCPTGNTVCTKKCVPPPPPCDKDAECDDGEACTADACVEGACEHTCVCLICPVSVDE